MFRGVGILLVSFLGICSLAANAQTLSTDDNRVKDRAELRAHIESIFQAYVDKDAIKVRALHSEDWRGFLTESRVIRRGIDEYMKAVEGGLQSKDGMVAFKVTEIDIRFYGDTAVVNYIAEVQVKSSDTILPDKLRTLDVYVKRNGAWNQVSSNVARHPEATAMQIGRARPVSPQFRKTILDAREAVWRAWFGNDKVKLEKVIPTDAVAINNDEEAWANQSAIFASAQRFADSGAKLTRLEFPRTEIQHYGNTVILYTTYLYEIEEKGKLRTSAGRGTEIFVMRNNVLVNTGWHLDSGK